MRWAKARHAATFLIHRDEQAIAPVDRAQIVGQRAQLIRVFAIAAKQNVARRIGLLKEGAFIRGQHRA